MSATEELERGQLAADVLGNRVFAESMTLIEQEITDKWRNEADPRNREWLWTLMQAHRKLQAALKDTMLTGKMRQKQIERERSLAERLGRPLQRG